MELYQLEHFVAVVDERSFTRAAERVSRTQGALSVSIRKLEEELGVPLMVRDSHECALTEAGRGLLPYARRMMELRDDLQRRMASLRTLAAGCVSIAAHESAAEYLLPAPLAAFHLQHPNVTLESRLCEGHEIAHLVAERGVDLGFGIRQTNLHGLCSEVLHMDPLVLVVAPGHRLAVTGTVSIEELAGERFLTHARHTTFTLTVKRLFADRRVAFDVAAELWNFETIKQFVCTGCGIAITPISVVRSDLVLGRLIAVQIEQMKINRTIEVVYRDHAPLLPAPANLLEFLRCWPWDRHAHLFARLPPAALDPIPFGERRRLDAEEAVREGDVEGLGLRTRA